jgi:hypothetical protein
MKETLKDVYREGLFQLHLIPIEKLSKPDSEEQTESIPSARWSASESRSSPMLNYFDNWRHSEFDCPQCKWHGLGSELSHGEMYRDSSELLCPSCGGEITYLLFPTLREYRANWDKLSDATRELVERRERLETQFDREGLKDPSQLPNIDSAEFVLDWDWDFTGEESSDRRTLIKHGDEVIFSEPAFYEGYERFVQVAEILRRRYGRAVRDLRPTERSKPYLYGDRWSAPDIVDRARRRIFGDELGMTLEELDTKYHALDGRSSEQKALVRELDGSRLKWTVEVLSVGNCLTGICVTFVSTSHAQLSVTTAEFSEEFRQRVFSLQPGDRITIEGSLEADIYQNHWNVACTAYQLVPSTNKH